MPISKEGQDSIRRLLGVDEELTLRAELRKVEMEMAVLQSKRRELVEKIEHQLLKRKAFREAVGKSNIDDIVGMFGKMVENPPLKSTMNLGDALEVILKADGPQRQKAIIEKIRIAGIKLSEKNPYVTLHAVIHRDARKRFVVLKDKRVGLVGQKNERQPSALRRKRLPK